MFEKKFKNKELELTKVETWKKFELFEFFEDLEKAAQILSNLDSGYSEDFKSLQDFHKVLLKEHNDLKYQNVPDFDRICIWFAPNSAWDDFVENQGFELGKGIYERADNWNNAVANNIYR